jgi:hypothetical protein
LLKVLPGLLLDEIVPPVQLSVKVGGVQLTTALHEAAAGTVIFAGHPDMTGGILSVTVTLKVHVAVLPAASIAV